MSKSMLLSSGMILILSALPVAAAPPAVGGYCSVCLYEVGKLVPGKKAFAAVYDRQAYYFPGDKQLKMFQSDPVKYIPALGGDCVVCLVKAGKRVAGDPKYWTKYDGRLYLFPSQKELNMFKANPDKYSTADIAYQCYCPVCLLDTKKYVPGDPKYVSVYDGIRYFFPGEERKAKFDATPAEYAPALGGKCVICLQDGGKHVHGSLKYGAFYDGRAYLFPNEQIRQKFLQNPKAYAFADVANNGNCIVCEKKAGKKIPGEMEHASMYKDRLYLFPGPNEKKMFDDAPEQFVSTGNGAKALPPPPPPSPKKGGQYGAETPPKNALTVVGKTACAGCEFGKAPLTNPDSLGLAVVTADKKVYIVEGAEKLYPQIYEGRFQSLPVQVSGTIRHQQGRFIWLDPVSLKKVQ